MSFRYATQYLLCTVTLFASACTETIIREVPAGSTESGVLAEQNAGDPDATGGASTPGIAPTTVPSPTRAPAPTLEPGTNTPPSASTAGSNLETPQAPETTAGDTLNPSVPVEGADSDANTPAGSFADQGAPAVTGAPGMTVDCQLMLPCRWSSNDGALSVTATSADNTAARERLSVSFTIDTDHDTSVSLGTSSAATGVGAASYVVNEQILGAGNGNSPQPLLAGASLRGRLNHSSGAGAALSTWSLAVFDNGFARNAMFSNLPVGAAINADADCANVLPCTWTTTSGDVTVTLLSAGGFTGSGRLSAHFSITPIGDRTLAIDAASKAVASDGSVFNSRTHELGQLSGYQQLTHSTVAGVSVPGSVDFFRSESQPNALRSLMLSVFDNEPSPRWNPIFLNVPVL